MPLAFAFRRFGIVRHPSAESHPAAPSVAEHSRELHDMDITRVVIMQHCRRDCTASVLPPGTRPRKPLARRKGAALGGPVTAEDGGLHGLHVIWWLVAGGAEGRGARLRLEGTRAALWILDLDRLEWKVVNSWSELC